MTAQDVPASGPDLETLRGWGYTLLPLPTRAKEPPPKGWVEGKEPFTVSGDANVAIGTRGELAILITNDDAATAWATEKFGPPHVRSRRGGHWYFGAREGQANEANKLTPVGTMEFHVRNKYALIPPSIHPDGDEANPLYGWVRSLPPLKDLPCAPDLGHLWHPSGEHHDKLVAMSAAAAHRGKDMGRIFSELASWRDGHLPDAHAHPDRELRQMAESAVAKFQVALPAVATANAPVGMTAPATIDTATQDPTQLALARTFLDTHHDELRLDTTTGTWRVFDGRAWGEDHRGRATDAMARIVDEIEDKRLRLRSSTNGFVVGALALASALPHARVTPEEWDNDGWLLPTRSGTLNLRTGVLRPSRPGDLLTRFSDVDWRGPDTPVPRWEAFIQWATRGSSPLASFLQRSAGYWLTGDILAQKWWLLWGKGGNGKDVFLTCMAGTQGGYAQSSPAGTFLHGTDADLVDRALSSMRGARLVYVSETLEMARLNEALVKAITGKPTIRVRPIYGVDYEMTLTMKLVMATNHRPVVGDESEGTWRRVLTVPFLAQVEEGEVDEHLAEDLLREEAAGILAWRVRGLLDYLKVGLRPPEEVTQARDDYRLESDILGQYMAVAVTLAGKNDEWIRARDNYQAYSVWARDRGERPWTETLFGRKLKDRGIESKSTSVGRYYALKLTEEGKKLLAHFPQQQAIREDGPSGPRGRWPR